ncbi:uncharacterized protein LOC144994392 isoform X2 [Oryzias latipes]
MKCVRLQEWSTILIFDMGYLLPPTGVPNVSLLTAVGAVVTKALKARASHPLGALPLSESGDETAQAFKESNISSNASSSSVSVMRKDLESVIFKGLHDSKLNRSIPVQSSLCSTSHSSDLLTCLQTQAFGDNPKRFCTYPSF